MKILVALSGGVDSSTVAHMLKAEGHELIGIMMKLWVDPLAPEVRRALPSKCCSIEHIERARNVCSTLDIPFYVLNLEEEFKREVVDPFIEDYRIGKTPNPCIECNRNIKFGVLHEKMKELGCEKLATGHYARTATEELSGGKTRTLLLQACDSQKDQSYYLYRLSQEQLRNALFPLGALQKTDVFAQAKEYGINIPDHYHESQDLCFFPEKEPTAFLERYIPEAKPGPIVTEGGETVGTHRGLPFYTEGQRKGLGIGGLKIPLHVTRKEHKSNTIYVAPSGADCKTAIKISHVHWVADSPQNSSSIPFETRVSSLGKRYESMLDLEGDSGVLRFTEGVRGAAPGQSAVLYRGEEVVGGGVIA